MRARSSWRPAHDFRQALLRSVVHHEDPHRCLPESRPRRSRRAFVTKACATAPAPLLPWQGPLSYCIAARVVIRNRISTLPPSLSRSPPGSNQRHQCVNIEQGAQPGTLATEQRPPSVQTQGSAFERANSARSQPWRLPHPAADASLGPPGELWRSIFHVRQTF